MDGGSAFLEILFFGMVAAFLVLRLRSVLGRRMGHERERRPENERIAPANRPSAKDNVVPLPAAQTSNDPVQRGLMEIRQVDGSFDPDGFTAGAKTAFELILNAYANGDRDTLRSLTSNSVYSVLDGEMRRREDEDQSLESTLVRIREAKITAAALRGSVARVTVQIASEQINVVRDGEGHAVKGKRGAIDSVVDVWTFERDTASKDPNWTLTEIQEPAAEEAEE